MPSASTIGLYALAAALPAALLVLYAIFRWRYLRLVKRTIYGDADGFAGDDVEVEGAQPNRAPLELRWHEGHGPPSPTPPDALADALRRTRAMRTALWVAGVLYLLTSLIVIWHGRAAGGELPKASFAVACTATLLPYVLILVFARLRWTAWLALLAAWVMVEFLLFAGALRLTPRTVVAAMVSGLDSVSLGLVCLALLVLRPIRPLLIGFAPLIVLLLLSAVGMNWLIATFEIPLSGSIPIGAAFGGVAVAAAGIAAAVVAIRKNWQRAAIGLFTTAVVCGVAALWFDVGRVSAVSLGVGAHGLVTLMLWALMTSLRRFQSAGHLPDEILHALVCWFVLTGLLTPFVVVGGGFSWWALLPFAVYVAALIPLLIRQRTAWRARTPKRLLLLRAFNQPAVRGRLLNVLDDSWRRVGRIDLVVGTDLAVRTLGPLVLEDFLLGRVHRHFIKNAPEAHQRLAGLPNQVALDGRYPLNEVHCLPSAWRLVVTQLSTAADVVMMDLRGFRASNHGAIFELTLIVHRVPLSRIVLLADATTDEQVLADVVHRAWSRLQAGSPNAGLVQPAIAVVRYSKRRPPTAMLNALFTAAQATAAGSAMAPEIQSAG